MTFATTLRLRGMTGARPRWSASTPPSPSGRASARRPKCWRQWKPPKFPPVASTAPPTLPPIRTTPRAALTFGNQKINLHEWGHEFKPHAHVPVPGSLDLCFIAAESLDAVIQKLGAAGVRIIEGPVRKTGAQGAIRSVYVRDPD